MGGVPERSKGEGAGEATTLRTTKPATAVDKIGQNRSPSIRHRLPPSAAEIEGGGRKEYSRAMSRCGGFGLNHLATSFVTH